MRLKLIHYWETVIDEIVMLNREATLNKISYGCNNPYSVSHLIS